jgi:hypothetical protein
VALRRVSHVKIVHDPQAGHAASTTEAKTYLSYFHDFVDLQPSTSRLKA